MRYHRAAHSNLFASFDWEQRVSAASRNAGHILAEIAGHLIRKNDRRPILQMECDRSVRADLGAIAALRASFHKQSLVHRTGRAQPIRPYRWQSRLLRCRRLMLGKLLCCLGDGHDGILEKVATSV